MFSFVPCECTQLYSVQQSLTPNGVILRSFPIKYFMVKFIKHGIKFYGKFSSKYILNPFKLLNSQDFIQINFINENDKN